MKRPVECAECQFVQINVRYYFLLLFNMLNSCQGFHTKFNHILIFNQVGVNHYTECQVFRNLGRTSSYNDLAFKLAAIVPLRLLLKVKEENSKGFNRLQFLLDTQTNSPSSFLNDDEISTKR